ncbi:hypothetical protein ILYODFUR_039105 [Ilyodon furcidens]|uniref:Uncharacterized protein n=1 Tax=Ilyodon furcidens TaxID=33524 RepID=A0ABV0ST93_9TELE
MCFQCYSKVAAGVGSLLVLYVSSSKCLILTLNITIRRSFNISILNLFCHVKPVMDSASLSLLQILIWPLVPREEEGVSVPAVINGLQAEDTLDRSPVHHRVRVGSTSPTSRF